MNTVKSDSWLLVELGAALLIICGLSFFRTPVYEKASWYIIGVFASAFTTVIGYKFGRSMPQQAGDPKDGQLVKTETTSATISAPAPPKE